MVTYFISFFLALNFFSYIISFYIKTYFSYYYPIVFILILFISTYISMTKFRNVDKIYFPSKINLIFLLLFILFYSVVSFLPYNSIGIDEYFRLGMARYIDNYGLPVSNELFVASSLEVKNYYYYYQFLAVSIHKVFFNIISLEFIYNYLLLYIKYLLTIFIFLDIYNSVLSFLKKEYYLVRDKKIFLEFYFSLGVISLILPPLPYSLGMISLFEQQSSFATFIILITVSLMADCLKKVKESKDISAIITSFTLIWMMILVLYVTKFPYLTILLVGVLFYTFVIILLNRSLLNYLITVTIFALIFLYIAFNLHPMLSQVKVYKDNSKVFFYISWFELIKNIGISGYFPWIKSIYLSTLFSFGILWVWIIIFSKNFLAKCKINYLNALYATLLIMVLSGYILTFFIKLKAYTGGAESYWSYAGWYSLTILISISFIFCVFLKRYVLILSIILCFSGSIFSYLALKKYPFPNPNSYADKAMSWCKEINNYRKINNKENNKCVINNPLPFKTVYALNAVCDCFTITTDIEKGYITVDAPIYSNSVILNQFINSSKDPTDKIKNYLNENNFSEMYLIGRQISDLDPKFERDKLSKDSSIYIITK
ncbi:hypothetical protein [Silvanigrella aquatica]|uniref:Uncharacterized protein n=1 Tax=Silvanigrella aquatica TaxID=1915309 RepID=A0A1L4D313_9BACT|nr:hypothetical protein [Silvanigrella aquatica]APJ04590.1 hypothetical protein AXG55_12010 [Silvanigrella aquatica]